MGVQPDHSDNFPKEFHPCPVCGDKGVYILRGEDTYLLRCKYCKQCKTVERETWLGDKEEAKLLAYGGVQV